MEYKNKPLNFYVIYSFDICADEREDLVSVNYMKPPASIMKRLTMTEGDEEYDYGHCWEYGKHRKYVGELTSEEFETFIDEIYLAAQDVETMGSLTEMGWLPAISFDYADDGYSDCVLIGNAYVTPFVEGETLGDDDWDAIKEMVIEKWG